MAFDVEQLINACGDLSQDAGILIRTQLEPLAGEGAPVKPPSYPGLLFQEDWRWWGDPPVKTRVIVIDNTPSQANRLEAALADLRVPLGLPEMVLDLSSIASLPPHLPDRISGFRFPHRQADAYLRDSMRNGIKFQNTPEGRAVLAATADNPQALFEWFPQALLFGYWQSHLGKKRSQARLARSWVSEIVGFDPASPDGARTKLRGLKGDPLNLSTDEAITYDQNDLLAAWNVVDRSERAARGRSGERLSNIGHGQVPFPESDAEAALGAVSFRAIQQTASVSVAGLRRIHSHNAEASARGRALLIALGVAAHVAAFGRGFSLRSGCDLRPISTQWTWLGGDTDTAIVPPSLAEALDLVRACVEQAKGASLTASGGWGRDPLVLTPNSSLTSAISKTWPLPEF